MILTPIAPERLEETLALYETALAGDPYLMPIFRRIAESRFRLADADAATWNRWHRDAVELTRRFGMNPIDEEPQAAYSWDGWHVRTISQPDVLIHEVAHFQVASPARRRMLDFGLGAGPETGEKAKADAQLSVGPMTREYEEALASLLGVLWEVELGQAGILAFQEQNWLEGAGRTSAADFFRRVLADLTAMGLLDAEGHPLYTVRQDEDPASAQQ